MLKKRKVAPSTEPPTEEAIRSWLITKTISEVNFRVIESVRQLLITNAPAKMNLAGNRHLRRRAGKIFLE